MNDRIKELEKQATVKGEEYLPGNDGHPTPTVYFDKEKFAELILQDVHQYVDSLDTAQIISNGILKRYGMAA